METLIALGAAVWALGKIAGAVLFALLMLFCGVVLVADYYKTRPQKPKTARSREDGAR